MAITNGYATLAEVKDYLRITGSGEDTQLEAAVETASRDIDHFCQRHFYQLTETRTLTATDRRELALGAFGDLDAVTEVATDAAGDGTFETVWASTDYQLLTADGTPNRNAGAEQRPYTMIRATGSHLWPLGRPWVSARTDRVRIQGTWGWPAVPTPVKQACLIMAAETYKMSEAPFGVAGFADYGVVRIRKNPMASAKLAPYRLVPVLVA